MIDRWGNTGTIFCWEMLNEADLWWGATPEQLAAWSKEMSAYVRSYEQQKWGRNHMVTVSIAKAMPDGSLGDVAFRRNDLDFATTHLYIGEANSPTEPIGPALATNRGISFALKAIQDHRPYIDGENGPINGWIADEKLDNEVFHNMSWAHMSSGGAGSAFRWPYRHPHHLTEGMYHTISLMSKFSSYVPWEKVCATSASRPKVSSSDNLVAFCSGSPEALIAWAAVKDSKTPAAWDLQIDWPGCPANAAYRAYNTKTGEWFASGTISTSGGKASIHLDGAPASVAVVVGKQ
jgi:mannan endo-1,4-beta-mannosidase